jgi:RecB family exonuclease
MTDPFTLADTPLVADFNRNGRGQPVITPASGGKPIAYNRPSSWGKKIEDMYGINQWEKRCVVAGLARTPSLVARALAVEADPKKWSKADKDALNLIADEAKTAARANQAADIGTALHRMTERLDLGEDLGTLPDPYKSDVAAYYRGMVEHGLQTHKAWVECRMVQDDLKLAGTCDRIVTHNGTNYIYDLKTGESIELAALGYAVQLAIYAHSHLYDIPTGGRTGIKVNQDVALIGHLPAGQATFTLHQVDIKAGWEAAQLAADIDRWRKRRNFYTPFNTNATPPTAMLEARVTNLRERCRTIVAISTTARDLLVLNMGLAELDLRRTDLTKADVDAAEMIIQAAERECNAPFNDLATPA